MCNDSDNARMASSFAQDLIQSDLRVKRRYVQIPRDQHELLESEDAWSDNLSKGPHGLLNVPDHVLQGVKSFHLRKHANTSTQGLPDVDTTTTLLTEDVNVSTRKLQETLSSQPLDTHADEENDEAEEIPWSPSQPDEADDPAQEPLEEQVKVIEAVSLPAVSRDFKSPSTPHKSTTRSQDPTTIPSSSVANSDDLEIEPPGFLSQEVDFPVNRGALRAITSPRPEPTPPSAQIPVATVASTVQSAAANKKRRLNDIPDPAYKNVPENAAIGTPSTLKWDTTALDAHQRSSVTAGSEINPSALQSIRENTSQSRPPLVTAEPTERRTKSSNLTATWEGRRQRLPSPHLSNTGLVAPLSTAGYPMFGNDGGGPPNAQPVRQDLTLTPYNEFKAVYPDYPETVRKFVSGCLNVKQVMRDRTLPEFLYDDFVRAFSTDYMLYISECNRKKAKTILPAVEWYNETTKDPEYMKKVIRKDNLAAILEAHADDVHAIRRSLGDSQSTASDSVVEDSDEEMLDVSARNDQEDEADESDLEDAHRPQLSPELHVTSPRFVASKKPHEQGQSESGAEFEEMTGNTGAPTKAADRDLQTEDRSVTQRESHTESSKQAAKPQSLPGSHLRSTPVQVPDMRSRSCNSEPRLHKTPTGRNLSSHLEGKVTSSSGSIATISPIQHLRRHSSSSREGQEIARGTGSHSEERGQKATLISPPQYPDIVLSKKRPRDLSIDEADDEEEEEDAFDPPVKEPMPPPSGLKRRQPESVAKSVLTPPARKSFPSTMPTAVKPIFIPSGPGTTVAGQASSRPSTASGMVSERGRSVSVSDTSYTNAARSKKRVGEAPAERSKKFKEFLMKRKSLGAPSSAPAKKQ